MEAERTSHDTPQFTPAELDAMRAQATTVGGDGALISIQVFGKGGGSWAPGIDPAVDYSKWGRWEAWQFLRFGELPDGSVGAIDTGDWIAWNRTTGQQMGFTEKDGMTAREQAVLFCRIQHGEIVAPEDMRGHPSSWPRNPSALPTREVVSMTVPHVAISIS